MLRKLYVYKYIRASSFKLMMILFCSNMMSFIVCDFITSIIPMSSNIYACIRIAFASERTVYSFNLHSRN